MKITFTCSLAFKISITMNLKSVERLSLNSRMPFCITSHDYKTHSMRDETTGSSYKFINTVPSRILMKNENEIFAKKAMERCLNDEEDD